MICDNCKKNYKMLDEKTNLCAFCFKDKFKIWSKSFSEEVKKR